MYHEVKQTVWHAEKMGGKVLWQEWTRMLVDRLARWPLGTCGTWSPAGVGI